MSKRRTSRYKLTEQEVKEIRIEEARIENTLTRVNSLLGKSEAITAK